MGDKYLLAVDGGGTKTEFCISDPDGGIVGSVFSGCSNYKSVGAEEAYHSFQTGCKKIREQLGIELNHIAHSVWGISGCDSQHDFEIVGELIGRLGLDRERVYLCNDGVLAFYAQACEPGLVIISGTGSIVLGVDESRNIRRAGGWGYNISDIGSGYWIGAEALKRALLYCDGCHRYSPLFKQIREYFHTDHYEELPYIVTEITDNYKIAKLAALVVKLAAVKEPVSYEIMSQGADLLAGLAKSTYDRLGFNRDMELQIVFSGGVLTTREYQKLLTQSLAERINLEHVTFSTQKHAPAYGGIKLARRMTDKGETGR